MPDSDRDRFASLPSLPRDEGGPVFAEPWQAQAFALAVRLSAQGHFTWKEWAAALADELKAAADRGQPDDGSRYYEYWLAALERLVTAKGLSNPNEMLARKEAWADAYRHTPHGKPVALANGSTVNVSNTVTSGSRRQLSCREICRFGRNRTTAALNRCARRRGSRQPEHKGR
jgi:nitrile hydratase accessory protein